MHFRVRGTLIAVAAAGCLSASAARAGDDGAAPIWTGLGSIVTPFIGFGHDEKPAIEYREHGKIVVPKSMDLPPPGVAPAASGGAWPIEQEVERKRLAKEEEKKKISTVPTKIRATQGFPNAPVTVRAADQPDGVLHEQDEKSKSGSLLQSLNPLGWVGLGKDNSTTSPRTEPDREWLTDPPAGYRAPVQSQAGASGQAAK